MILDNKIHGILLTPLQIIDTPGGNVFHGMRNDSPGYSGFGEVYFSSIEKDVIKGWKRHRQMTLNLVVPIGSVRFVIYDDRVESSTYQMFQQVILSIKNYQRLTVPPMLWLAFQGLSDEKSLLLNVASIPHDPNEVDQKLVDEISFVW